MHAELRNFLVRLAGVVGFTLVPVMLTALLTLPFGIGPDSGGTPALDAASLRHMT